MAFAKRNIKQPIIYDLQKLVLILNLTRSTEARRRDGEGGGIRKEFQGY